MTTEWKEVIDPEELFHLKRRGWEIQHRGIGDWIPILDVKP